MHITVSRILTVLLAASALTVAAWLAGLRGKSPAEPPPAAKIEVSPSDLAVRPPDLRELALRMNGGGTVAPTPEQVEEEKRTIAAQVEAAGESLNAIDPQERIGGAMQLAAYPTPEAEKLLTQSLATDADAEVRKTAAESLRSFGSLREKTVQALLASLDDESEAVRANALLALQSFLQKQERDAPRYKAVVKSLRQKAKDRRTAQDIRKEIQDYLRDQS